MPFGAGWEWRFSSHPRPVRGGWAAVSPSARLTGVKRDFRAADGRQHRGVSLQHNAGPEAEKGVASGAARLEAIAASGSALLTLRQLEPAKGTAERSPHSTRPTVSRSTPPTQCRAGGGEKIPACPDHRKVASYSIEAHAPNSTTG